MHSAFKRAVNEEGIIPLWKQKQYHETKGEKRRRKRKEAAQNRRKEQNKLKYLGSN
jgi:ribosomal protein S21